MWNIAKYFLKTGDDGYYTAEYEKNLRACEADCGMRFNGAPMHKRACSCACDFLGEPEECGAFSFKANAIVIMISLVMYKFLVN